MLAYDAYAEMVLLMALTMASFVAFGIGTSYEVQARKDGAPRTRWAARVCLGLGWLLLGIGVASVVIFCTTTGARWLESTWFASGMVALALIPRWIAWFAAREPSAGSVARWAYVLLVGAVIVAFVATSCAGGWWLGEALDAWRR
ncbi:MAG: hypothetical protein AB7O97_15220 [Planctomycetota bacterium]